MCINLCVQVCITFVYKPLCINRCTSALCINLANESSDAESDLAGPLSVGRGGGRGAHRRSVRGILHMRMPD